MGTVRNGGIMIRVAICDDDTVMLDYANNQINLIAEKLKKDILIQTFTDGNDMLSKDIKQISSFDIIFLDIDMPTIGGFEVAEFIRKFNEHLIIIFLTSMEELVYESLKYKPFRFIRKQKLNIELNEVLCSAISAVENNSIHYYIFKTEHGELKIGIQDIFYVECLNRKIYMKTVDKQYCLIGLQFNEIINEFLNKSFVLIHRSCIVNLKCIYSIGKIDITLDNGERLPISRYKVSDVKKAFTLYAG